MIDQHFAWPSGYTQPPKGMIWHMFLRFDVEQDLPEDHTMDPNNRREPDLGKSQILSLRWL